MAAQTMTEPNPHPQNDLTEEHNSQHSVHFSLTSPRCKENLHSSKKPSIHVPNYGDFDDDIGF